MVRKQWLLVVWVLVLSVSVAGATTYYVDYNNGNDLNNGQSSGSAWKTINKVNNSSFQPGDVVRFACGQSWTDCLEIWDDGADGNPITYTSFGTGTKPIIRNPGVSYGCAIELGGNWIVIDGLMVREGHEAAIHAWGSYNVVQNCEITEAGTGVYLEGQYNLITNNYIHDMTMIEDTSSPSYDDYGAVGVWIESTHNEISYNQLYNCQAHSYDYGTDGGAFEFYGTVDYTLIHHNYAQDCDGSLEAGGVPGYARTIDIYYNIFVNNGMLACLHTWGGDGTDPLVVENFVMYNNVIVEDEPGYSWYFLDGNQDNSDVYVYNNIFYGNGDIRVAASGSNYTHHENNIYYNTQSLEFSLGTGESTSNPQFVDLSGRDFHLQSDSVGIDGGQAIGSGQVDYDGTAVPINGLTDIGVYEHGSSPSDTQAPSVPTGLTVDGVTASTVALSWTASTDDTAVAGYRVFRDGGSIGTVSGTAYTDLGLASGTAYSYSVSAFDAAANESAACSPVFATTLSPDTQPPTVPTGLAVDSVTASTVALSWTASSDDTAVTGYRVFRDGGSIGTVSGAAYTDGGLACCTSYSYSVSAFDAASNESSACTPATADTPGESQSTDLSGDGNVDIADLAVLATNWLGTGCGVTGDLLLDQAVNLSDFDVLAGDWGAVSVDNLIENGSFESGIDVWGNPAGPAAGNGSVDTTVARTGSASFKAVGGSEYAYLDQTPTLTPSTSYTMSCWIKVDAVDGGNARCRPVQLDPTTIPYLGTPISGTSDWTKSEVTFTTESDYAGGRVDLLWDHDTGTAWFDDAILVEN